MIKRACLGVPGPVTNDAILLTNIKPLSFSISGLRAALGLDSVFVINDFGGNAASIRFMKEDDLLQIGTTPAAIGGPLAIVGPGTGTGLSYLVPSGENRWTPVMTEGGNVTLGVIDDEDRKLADAITARELQEWGGSLSLEYFVSGPGLHRLYTTVCRLRGRPVIFESPEEVSKFARANGDGTREADPEAKESVRLFFKYFGRWAGDIVLSGGAVGGLFITSAMLNNMKPHLLDSEFRAHFDAKGRYRAYNEQVPTFLVTHDYPGLVGLSALGE
jgi:glucokinase